MTLEGPAASRGTRGEAQMSCAVAGCDEADVVKQGLTRGGLEVPDIEYFEVCRVHFREAGLGGELTIRGVVYWCWAYVARMAAGR